jgi:hypothetical protein
VTTMVKWMVIERSSQKGLFSNLRLISRVREWLGNRMIEFDLYFYCNIFSFYFILAPHSQANCK